MKLKLTKDWDIGEQIGQGGFGVVKLATSGNEEAVAKFIPKAPGADRELLFVDLDSARNVVPILDSGETEDSWVLVMPRADKNLRQYIEEEGPTISTDQTRVILADIVTALVDLADKVVHRDLKPENVLFLDGHWCLADFGISRYAQATTAPDTQKFAMSPPYVAPERWRNERAATASDVYAAGVIGYEMLAGNRPFPGPGLEDFREQHLHADSAPLEQVDAPLASLVEECLIKASGARPSPANLMARLERAATPPNSPGLARLQEANRIEANRHAEAARRVSEASTEADRRNALLDAARQGLEALSNTLANAIAAAAPAAQTQSGRGGEWSMNIGSAELQFSGLKAVAAQPWGRAVSLDVIACAAVGVRIPPNRSGYEGRAHSLWFCDAKSAGEYGWFETAFMFLQSMAQPVSINPFALAPGAKAAGAVGHGVNECQVAWPFTRLDGEDLEEFISRWAEWLADGSEGRLHHPTTIPDRSPAGSWRQA
jgi:hypothetical protein